MFDSILIILPLIVVAIGIVLLIKIVKKKNKKYNKDE